MPKYTPGPWRIESDGIAYAISGPAFKSGYYNCLENEADARLIAAAPDLYQVALWADRISKLDPNSLVDLLQIIAIQGALKAVTPGALAKAEGHAHE